MSDQSQTINTLEKLTQLLSQNHITERQGVAIHRHPRRIGMTYAATASMVSLLAIKWPLLTLFAVVAMVWSCLKDVQMKRGWVSRLSTRSCGENLIVWHQCRQFNSEDDLPPDVVIALPWNLTPNMPQKGMNGLCFVCATMPLFPLAISIPAVQIAVPLLLLSTALLMYQGFSKTLPPLHPYVLKTIQSLEDVLSPIRHAIVMFDGGSDTAALDTFIQNYRHILNPEHTSLILIEPDSQETINYSTAVALQKEDNCQKLPRWSWGTPYAQNGWTVTHIKGDFDPALVQHCLEVSSVPEPETDEAPAP